MITVESLMSINKNDLKEASKGIDKSDLSQLVQWLSEKDDKIRYQSLLMLQNRSLYFGDVYSFWDIFCNKMKSENSYQRSIGLMLIADNVKWDKDNRIDDVIDDYLLLLNDEKPITVRQCIQALHNIVPYKSHLHSKIANNLISVNIMDVKETMRKLILLDILEILAIIRKQQSTDEIENYIFKALTGEILDKKSKKQIESML
ncbi:hypothetical protein [Sedimentibacter sp.]|uniref:hypothetical protein n=1 Tax=Sedimentibacter sp. TaxID=1960295 RepID=UPI00289B120F|nr:hypothetical protein [Sedimentibacter sp.]